MNNISTYRNAGKLIGLTEQDSEAVLSYILDEYRKIDGREDAGVDWVDIISEILDEIKINKTKKYLMVAVAGNIEIQRWVVSETEKEARNKFWLSLSDGERDSLESIECIEEQN